MRAGQQWEVCEARTRHRPSGAIAGELGLGDAAAWPPCGGFRGVTDETDSLGRISPLF